jgi:hypothetical protein
MSSTVDDLPHSFEDDFLPDPPRFKRAVSDPAATGYISLEALQYDTHNDEFVFPQLLSFRQEAAQDVYDTLPDRLHQHIQQMRLFERRQKGLRAQMDTLNSVLKPMNQWPTRIPSIRPFERQEGKSLAELWYRTVKADSNTCVVQLSELTWQYYELAEEFTNICQDDSWMVDPWDAGRRRMTLEYLLRKYVEKKFKEMDHIMETLRDATRQATLGVVGFYCLCNPVNYCGISDKKPLLARDRWAERVMEVFLLGLADMEPIDYNKTNLARSVQRYITDPTILHWGPDWAEKAANMSELEKKMKYGSRGSGWWRDNPDEVGHDHRRLSEGLWEKDFGRDMYMYRSWGTRRLKDLVLAEKEFLRKNGGDPSTVTEASLYKERYALLARLRGAKGDGAEYEAVLSDISSLVSEYNASKPAANPNVDEASGASITDLRAMYDKSRSRSRKATPEGRLQVAEEFRRRRQMEIDGYDQQGLGAFQNERPPVEGTCPYQPEYFPLEVVVRPAVPVEKTEEEEEIAKKGVQWLNSVGKDNWRWKLGKSRSTGAQSGLLAGLPEWERSFTENALGTWQPEYFSETHQGPPELPGENTPASDRGTSTSIDGPPVLVSKGKEKSQGWIDALPEEMEALPHSEDQTLEGEPSGEEAADSVVAEAADPTGHDGMETTEGPKAEQVSDKTDTPNVDSSPGTAAGAFEGSSSDGSTPSKKWRLWPFG